MLTTRILLTGFIFAFVGQASANVSHINHGIVVKGSTPFSEIVKVNNTLYLSGQVGLVPETQKLISGGVTEETRQTMDNIKAVLVSQGYQLNNVVKCTVFLNDMKNFTAFNDVYKQYFSSERLPARSTVGVNGLALNAKVEIECLAAK